MERDELFWFVDKADAGIEDLLKTEDIIRIALILKHMENINHIHL